MRDINGVTHFLFSGIRVTDLDDNDVDNSDLLFAELGEGPVTGATLTALDVATTDAITPRTNNEGRPGRFLLPREAVDVSADGGLSWFDIGTIERAPIIARVVAAERAATGDNTAYALADGTRGDFASPEHSHAGEGGTVTPDASPTAKGVLRLAGDLGGTADAPLVPGLATRVRTDAPQGLSVEQQQQARDNIGAGTGTSDLTLGTTATTAKRGDYTPTKTDVGLSAVDNTSDASKPVSAAQQAALNGKANSSAGVTANERARLAVLNPLATPLVDGQTLIYDETSGELRPGAVPGGTVDAEDVTSGMFNLARATPGALFVLGRNANGSWPLRPTPRTDIRFAWFGDREGAEPAGLLVGTDFRWFAGAVTGA